MFTIGGEGMQILTFARHSWPFFSEDSLAYHTNYSRFLKNPEKSAELYGEGNKQQLCLGDCFSLSVINSVLILITFPAKNFGSECFYRVPRNVIWVISRNPERTVLGS